MPQAAIGSGDVEITLDGQKLVLKPTLEACIALSGLAGGIQPLVQACLRHDFAVIQEIIAQGLGLTPTGRKGLDEKVFRSGLFNLSGPCINFLNNVANGGRPLSEEGGGGSGEDPPS